MRDARRQEEDLPFADRNVPRLAVLEDAQGDVSLELVEEIEQPWQPIVYLVHMEDALTLKNIQFCDRQMETVLDIKKL